MSSTGSQQNSTPASNNSAVASAPSYASAAGAAKKSSTPVVATGSNPPIVAAGSSAPAASHAKSSSVSPMNGRPSITPAVPAMAGAPAVAHGTSTVNGDHNRKSSVTMNTNGPNNYSTNGGSGNNRPSTIQFGFQDSPAVKHSSPQPGSAPIPIPGNNNPRVTSPQNSPSPIPQPSASGGRPPSSAQQGNSMTFGSFSGGDGDRSHLRNPSSSHDPNALGSQPSPHVRRGSHASDMSSQAGGPPPGTLGRGNYPGPNRGGRGGYNNSYNQPTGYPPNNYARGPQGSQGRGGMPPNFGNNRQQQFGTPPPHNRSPALPPAMPHQPPNVNPNAMPPYYYGPMAPGQMQPVNNTLPFSHVHHEGHPQKFGKKKGVRRDSEKSASHNRPMGLMNNDHHGNNPKARRYSRRFVDQRPGNLDTQPHTQVHINHMDRAPVTELPMPPPLHQPYPVQAPLPTSSGRIDLSPESGNFDRLLTNAQNFYPSQFDPNMRPGMPMPGYPMYPIMNPQGQSPAPHFQQPYNPNPYHAQGAQPMSRNNSQVSADQRPASSTGPNQTPVVSSVTPQSQHAQIKPAVVSSPQFTLPKKKNAAITIKNAAGDVVDLTHLKPPASPAPSSQQSKTPPVVAKTPTPPPKTSTPQSATSTHTRSDSTTTKTAEEVRNEFKEKMKQAAAGEKTKEDDSGKTTSDKSEADKPKDEAQSKPEQHDVNEANAPADASTKDTDTKAETVSEAKAPAAKEEATAAGPADEEDEMERIIREMEEEDARREAEAEKHNQRIAAEKAAKKQAEEETRKKTAADSDRQLREAEAEMERLEEERERKRAQQGSSAPSVSDLLKKGASKQVDTSAPDTATNDTATKLANLSLSDKPSAAAPAKPSPGSRGPKPAALNLTPLNTKSVEPPQPSAALQSLKTARLLDVMKTDIYPPGIQSPNPALNAAVAKKGTSFKYDPAFLLQFQGVFTEQPSLDFNQQVKSLIGDNDGGRSASARTPAGGSNRQNSRPGVGSFPGSMGNFGNPVGGRTLPPGTTSDQRFQMSDRTGSRPGMAPPMASFQRPGGAFPGGSQMSRTPSSSNMGSMPHSPRQSSRRNASRQSTMNPKQEAQAAKTMPLTAGMKIENLTVSTTGWKPTSLANKSSSLATQSGLMDPAMVQRKVKAALNKMTPEKFDKISDQILEIAAQSKDESDGRTLRQVIQLTFEKATDEAHWASMYAKFCKRMLETMSPEIRDEGITDKNGQVVSGGALFRKYLLNRCQEEFERGWQTLLPQAPTEEKDNKTEGAAMLSEEYYIAAAAKRRGLGLVQFIGELYKLGMLTERIMHECVKKLVDYSGTPDEAEIESLCKLLRTIGGNLDATEKSKAYMNVYFGRIQSMIELPDLPSRLQFMLMDIVDLRKANWHSKEANKGPKTIAEVRAEAEALAAQKAAEAARSNTRGGGGRAPAGRGDSRNFSSGFPQPVQNQVGMDDLRRLKGGAGRTTSSHMTLGPMSMLNSRSNSGRRLGPGGALNRGADDSGASSRTGTPPVREAQSSTNSFGLLANMDSENPASPPSAAASPALAKVAPDTAATSENKSG
ncbi:hypothetical protein F4778DRAFT_635080 [Xylariomycetidae sp. FL2044]|nr:hypothetical protein F4778DRAFT_635080 [Xylariomycetidae sp. FL2044]